MKGYCPESYGERIADVYDDWFGGVSDVDTTVAFLDALVSARPARFLELAVGTGRLALPLAALGHDVTGIDVSAAMLERLQANDERHLVTTIHGDMVDGLPAETFDVVFVAFNSLFMLVDADRQEACFRAVRERLGPAGAFVVEAFVPREPPRSGSHVEVRSMTADRVVLAADITDPVAQTVTGQFVELREGDPVRLHPYVLRWSRPSELDGWAAAAGLGLAERFGDVARGPFTDDSPYHVSVFRPC